MYEVDLAIKIVGPGKMPEVTYLCRGCKKVLPPPPVYMHRFGTLPYGECPDLCSWFELAQRFNMFVDKVREKINLEYAGVKEGLERFQ